MIPVIETNAYGFCRNTRSFQIYARKWNFCFFSVKINSLFLVMNPNLRKILRKDDQIIFYAAVIYGIFINASYYSHFCSIKSQIGITTSAKWDSLYHKQLSNTIINILWLSLLQGEHCSAPARCSSRGNPLLSNPQL